MWTWKKTEYRVLSQFANFSKHSKVLNSFKNELPVLNELRDKPDGCRQMVEAVYKALTKREVRYSLEEYNSSQDSQQIRTPTEILDSKSQGTCLDLAVLFCGMCLRYELIPLLIVSGNHAWVAVSLAQWLHECKASAREGKNLFKDGLLTDKEKAAELCNLVEDEEAYIAIECTGFTQGRFSKSFDEAEQEGLKRLRNFSSRNGGFILDVPIAHDFYWRDLCTNRLEAEPIKRLINSPLTNGGNPLTELYVPLGLIERKPDAQRRPKENASPPEESPFNEPDYQYEVVREYEHKEFFEEVLKHKSSKRSQGKRLAIVGDPGGGKTTLLQRIAYWVLNEKQGLPIWVPLGDVNENWVKGRDETDEGWLYRYLSENWLRNVAREPEKTPIELRQTFKELLKSGQVWLLLDGADEMALSHPLARVKEQLAKGWADSVRVVLNCRLNWWEVEKEALWEKFDIYRTLEFNYPDQVHEFINNWFDKDNQKAKGLQDKLAEESRKRLQDLVKNPLRLALLCRIWKEYQGDLPDTKADFYRLLVENHYKWKDDSTNEEFDIKDRKEELNRALGQLARDAIDSKDFRFRLRESSIRKYLKDRNVKDSLFWWALKLGWLLDVGLPREEERNRGEKVYAFFHPTFQEYFAATGVDNYNFFLPMEHRDRPVKDKNNQEKYERYRIFEPQWQEAILLWLGRPYKEVTKEQKEDFINALVEFEDGCNHFYWFRALFLAAMGAAEFRDCTRTDEIVALVVEFGFGHFDTEEREWEKFLAPIAEGARAALLKTECTKAVDALEELIYDFQDYNTFLQVVESLGKIDKGKPIAVEALTHFIESFNWGEEIRWQAVELLAKIDPSNPIISATLYDLLESSNDESVRLEAIKILSYLNKDNHKTIALLEDLIKNYQDEEILQKAAFCLGKIDKGNPIAIDALAQLIQNYQANYSQVVKDLWEIGNGNSKAIAALVVVLKNPQNAEACTIAAESLGQIDQYKPIAINILVELIGNSQNEYVRLQAAESLGQIDRYHPKVIKTIVDFIDNSENEFRRGLAATNLGQIDKGNSKAIATLVYLIQTPQLKITRELAVMGLKATLIETQLAGVITTLKDYLSEQTNENSPSQFAACHEIIWYCAQNMTYPAFYQAWHQQEVVDKTTTPDNQSLNQADLPQSLQSTIANDLQLSKIIHLVCIDTSKFIESDNPAAKKIYVEMVKQGCSKSDDDIPKTMQDLQVYWDLLTIESDRTIVLVFYQNASAEARESFSPTFLTNLSKFEGAICAVTDQPFDHIPLKYFTPSQPIEDVVEWIRASAMEQ